MSESSKHYRPGTHPSLPPPVDQSGPLQWMRENLFSSWLNTALTLLSIYVLYLVVPAVLDWALLSATFEASSRAECQALNDGACWAFIAERFDQFVYGFYPEALRWRPNLCFALLFVALAPVLFDSVPQRRRMLWFTAAYPFIAYWLLCGGFGLTPVETTRFGGFLLTLVIGVTGIAASLPLGIVLALGRASDKPVFKVTCTMFIEFIRGVPLITLLFVASTMLNYFLPPGTTFDLLARVLIMVTLFASAYIAEVVRGGLQAIPKGQYEAAVASGLGYWQMMRLVVLPQALKISIPGIVNTFIGLFKDTTLVVIIGLLDPLGIGGAALSDSNWQGLSTEVYVFIAIFFFICCFSMSRYSLYLERKLERGHRS
ncbi:MAG: amino acid ABC transporter permease [Gammaproteobacteria bacterium]|nr:amino acid ABC transporter permease [Gammaproteobacteria bacterium]